VPWPFKYGPQGHNAKLYWDSDYCQHGSFEHARRKYLQNAKSVINADIDELVLSHSGESVCAAAERSWTGIVRYYGRWIVGGSETATTEPVPRNRHKEFETVLKPDTRKKLGILTVDANRCLAKWTVVPRRCPDWSQWRPHVINGWPPARLWTTSFNYRHFRELSNGWKYKREASGAFDAKLHERDTALVDAMSGVNWSA
jgi:hypothetical protein